MGTPEQPQPVNIPEPREPHDDIIGPNGPSTTPPATPGTGPDDGDNLG